MGYPQVAGVRHIRTTGVAHNHHFLQINEHWYFPDGDYEISVYARIVNGKGPKLLGKLRVALTDAEATGLYIRQSGVLFTWNPDTGVYDVSPAPEGKERAQYGIP